MLSCLVAVCLLNPSPRVIDFNPRADNLRAIVAQLAQVTGEKLEVDGDIAHEVVFVQMGKTDGTVIRDEIAKAVVGTWVSKDGVLVLERTPTQKSDIWNQHLEYRRKEVDRSLAKIEKELEKPFNARALLDGLNKLPDEGSFGNDRQAAMARHRTQQQLFEMGPLARLMRRMLLACDRNDLAAVGPHERRLFRFRGNKRQGKINEAAFRTAAALFAKEQLAWLEITANNPFPEDRSGRMVSDPRAQTRISEKAALDAELVVLRGEMASLFNVNLYGNSEHFGRTTLCQMDVPGASREYLNAVAQGVQVDQNDPVVELSAESQIVVNAVKTLWTQDRSYVASPELLKLISEVGQKEPLTWILSEVFSNYADHGGVNVVASLPDEAFPLAVFGGPNKVRVQQAINSLLKSGVLKLEKAGNWHRFTPVDRWESAIDFTPRLAMSKLIKSMIEKGRVDVRDYATYAFESKRLNRGGLADIFAMMIDPAMAGGMDFASWDGMRLYGSFTPKTRQDLEQGATINYAGLNGAQKQIVERIIYRDVIRSEERIDKGTTQIGKVTIEPTDTYVNGLPPGAQVVSKSNISEIIVAYGKDKNGKVRVLRTINPWTLAHVLGEGLEDKSVQIKYGLSNLVGFAPGVDRLLSLRIVVVPGVWKETPLMIPGHDENAKPVAWERLPEKQRKQIEDAIKQYKDSRPAQGGGTPPPR